MSARRTDPGDAPAANAETDFRRDLVSLIPHLRAFARALAGERAAADDLAQETLTRAWAARARFEPGTNLRAWLFMILRNRFYSDRRRAWREAPLEAEAAAGLAAPDDPEAPLALDEVRLCLAGLPDDQREALVLVAAGGFAYEEAAAICGCAVGTVKSRVSRARRAISDRLGRGEFVRDGRPASEAFGAIMAVSDRLSAAR